MNFDLFAWICMSLATIVQTTQKMPLSLTTISIIGEQCQNKLMLSETISSHRLLDVITRYNAEKKPTLIFCGTRKGTTQAGGFLSTKHLSQCSLSNRSKNSLRTGYITANLPSRFPTSKCIVANRQSTARFNTKRSYYLRGFFFYFSTALV